VNADEDLAMSHAELAHAAARPTADMDPRDAGHWQSVYHMQVAIYHQLRALTDAVRRQR
jgi:hypothetical protein